MQLAELIQGIDGAEIRGDASIDIGGLAYNSKKAKSGMLFIAIRGYRTDGNLYAVNAVRQGAVAVVTDDPALRVNAVTVRVPDARRAMALIADRFYGSPQRNLMMAGITGTNGKTTTSYMVKSIFDRGGMKCGLIGTIQHLAGGKNVTSLNTTPEAPDIHGFLADMVRAGESACVMEVSSHSLTLSRVYGIEYRAAAFLNLTRDHLDFHGTQENYLEAKSLLFSSLSGDAAAVVNRDDRFADYIEKISRDAHIITFGSDGSSDIHPLRTELLADRSEVVFATPAGEVACTIPLPGWFNISNAMAAAGIALACGFPADVIAGGLEHMAAVPGRSQIIDEGQDFTVIVDYAHTPDALERVLTAARDTIRGRLISIFGCGGDRDRGKRPLMGGISTRIADVTIITSDNPRTEDPDAIIREVETGVDSGAVYEIVPDRDAAIARAIGIARPGDTVVLAGKGHEDYQIIGATKIHFDDAETVRRYLGNRP